MTAHMLKDMAAQFVVGEEVSLRAIGQAIAGGQVCIHDTVLTLTLRMYRFQGCKLRSPLTIDLLCYIFANCWAGCGRRLGA